MKHSFYIDPDISKAETLPGWFYHDTDIFDAIKEKVFVKTWQWIGEDRLVDLAEMVHPFNMLEGFLGEPMLLIRNIDDSLNCLSNVCTHRGNIVVNNAGKHKSLNCLYHGRRFDLDGSFKSMPEFKQVQDFPRPCDHLHKFPLVQWGPFLFTSINPDFDFSEILAVMNQRIGFLSLQDFRLQESSNKEYLINAHWALYCDNYLEGFHIPFVHQDLNAILDYGQYSTVLYDHCNLQIGYALEGEEKFELPIGHIDYGRNISAYYFWVFPNMMFNFYPWGLSINIVKPITKDKTKVSFLSYLYDESKLYSGAGAMLDKVEREDEFVVENVHRGLKSRVYKSGRFSPSKEQGTHHFHRLLAEYLGK
jgi:choline monooxygenase